jgi:hypothetical protein
VDAGLLERPAIVGRDILCVPLLPHAFERFGRLRMLLKKVVCFVGILGQIKEVAAIVLPD